MTDKSISSEKIAESATIHSFVNCYLRETGNYDRLKPDEISITARDGRNDGGDDNNDNGESDGNGGRLSCDTVFWSELSTLNLDLLFPVRYESPTGRHLFDLPVYVRSAGDWIELDYTTLASLIVRELALSRSDSDDSADELLLRVIRSARNIERYVAARDDFEQLYGFETTFRDAEQSLVFGHLLHPTPKSRQGIARRDAPTYAPELRGAFQLHYFRADPEIVTQGSAREESATEWVKSELRDDPNVSNAFISSHVDSEDALLPIHPWQAEYLLDQPHVQQAIEDGCLEHLGAHGRTFYPTSSVRTLYNPTAAFMVKGSLDVKITNSVRTNKRPELERGVAVSELLETELGAQLRERFPDFQIVRDPASLTLDIGTERESGFEVVLRDNPFRGDAATNATPVVALCQDHLYRTTDRTDHNASRLDHIIRTLADREGRTTATVSEDWFRQYLAISVRPVLWLYLTHGVGVEAHQQNSVLALDDGYPDQFYYRDNQGYYFCESTYEAVDALLPGVGERADTICPDAIADERIRYYVILNNTFGLINAFGCADLVDERRLLELLREELNRLQAFDREASNLLEPLLTSPTIPCKANLLTRFHGMDELEASIENQSVYTEIDNPLVTEREAQ
ncbi:IucA/IucC family protein [Halocatena marina]|uniref:IucA/IucC family protein n=1 Tax=Halocatena marina TaxID=2934937 RepID=A0ABD5YUG4_9EURY|nr:IucA/IucC family protein [Halocatena marina]